MTRRKSIPPRHMAISPAMTKEEYDIVAPMLTRPLTGGPMRKHGPDAPVPAPFQGGGVLGLVPPLPRS